MPTPRSGGASGSDGRRIYLAGGEVTTKDLVGAFRSVEAYDPLTNSWMTLPSMPMPRHGIAGAVIGESLPPGERDDAVGRSADLPRPDALDAHGAARHPGAAVRCAAANRCGQELGRGASRRLRHRLRAPTAAPSQPSTTAGGAAAAALSRPAQRVSTRYNVNSPQGQVMLAKYARAIEIMRELPEHDQRSWKWWWNTHWVKGFPAALWDLLQEAEGGSDRLTPAGTSSRC